jgi:leucyl-tRNA synthetase
VANPALLPGAAAIGLAPEHPAISAFTEAGLLTSSTLDALSKLAHSARVVGNQDYSASRLDANQVVKLEVTSVNPLTEAVVPIFVFAGLDLRSQDGVAVLFPAHLRADARLAGLAGVETKPILGAPSGDKDPFEWDPSWIYTDQSPLAGRTAREGESWVSEELVRQGVGGPSVRYRLREWNIARQRYWGHPIPIIHCEACGAVPVPESDLPVLLPLDVDLEPHGNPLDRHPTFSKVNCPRCD